MFDEAIELSTLKVSLSARTGIPLNLISSNRMYGSFSHGNASMIYLDEDSNATSDPEAIETVQVTLVARTDRPDSNYTNNNTYGNFTAPGDHFRRRLLTQTIYCRNNI